MQARIRRVLENSPGALLPVSAVVMAFSAYFSMYAFRKPFTAATYEGGHFLGTGVELKSAFVISQIIGYTLSKYLGIKVCAEVTSATRLKWLLGAILFSEVALLLFAVLPGQWKILAIFLNGLPLGM